MKPLRELVPAKNVKTPDLFTVKDFLRFHAAAGKGMVVEQTTCDSLLAQHICGVVFCRLHPCYGHRDK